MLRLFRHLVTIPQQLWTHLNLVVLSSVLDGVLKRAEKG
jgi:hypothetical protein